MYLTQEKKEEIFNEYGKNGKDTGSAEAQIALFTSRIQHLTGLGAVPLAVWAHGNLPHQIWCGNNTVPQAILKGRRGCRL